MARTKTKRYFITNEVSNAAIHLPFLRSMKQWAKATGGEIVVLRSLYKLRQATPNAAAEDYTFNEELDEFYLKRQKKIGNILVQADVNILQTAVLPLSGFGNYGKGATCIFGHPRQHLESLPTVGNRPPQFLLSTGTCVNNRYNVGKAGRKAQFAQVLGGVIVEVGNKGTHFRHVHASKKNGAFSDLGFTFSENGVHREKVKCIIFGDTHCPYQDEPLYDEMLDTLIPEILNRQYKGTELVFHDIYDFALRNHHNKNNPIQAAGFASQSVEQELNEVKYFLSDKRLHVFDKISLVDSNHDRALDRWINENDWRKDPTNSELMLWLAWAKLKSTTMKNGEPTTTSALEIWLRNTGLLEKYNIEFLKGSKLVQGWELALHGDKGLNGARGSLASYAKIPARTIIGHSHSTGMRDGTIQVGHTRLPAAYAQGGASSWSQSICLIYQTSKAQLLVFDKNRRCSDPNTVKLYAKSAKQKK